MTQLSPKIEFQTTLTSVADELQSHREDRWFKLACCMAISEMAFNGASQEQLLGARNFIHTLQNLWEKEQGRPQLPRKSLTMDEAGGQAK